jgi:hypothetical protein
LPALTEAQVLGLPDVISNDRFTVNFGAIPTFGDTSTSLLIKCMDVYIPGINNERFEVGLGTMYRSFRGKRNYQRSMMMTFVETVDLSTLQALREWLEFIAGTSSGNSQGFIASYGVTPTITAYDTAGNAADTITLVNCFPYQLQDIALSTAQGTQAMLVQCDFSYDVPNYLSVQQT